MLSAMAAYELSFNFGQLQKKGTIISNIEKFYKPTKIAESHVANIRNMIWMFVWLCCKFLTLHNGHY